MKNLLFFCMLVMVGCSSGTKVVQVEEPRYGECNDSNLETDAFNKCILENRVPDCVEVIVNEGDPDEYTQEGAQMLEEMTCDQLRDYVNE